MKYIQLFDPPSSHHHLLELVKVQSSRSVLVHLLNDVIEIILSQGCVYLTQNLLVGNNL